MMEKLVVLASWVSILSFLIYGLACCLSDKLTAEFERYGVASLRRLIGTLEVMGALGQLVGLCYTSWLLPLSSSGLALLMVCALVVRLKIKDPWLASVPAIVLCLLNLSIVLDKWG